MKIAYLMLCHRNAEQINLLINELDDGNSTFFIHVDRKVNNLNINMKSNAHLVDDLNRTDVRWATISMVEATLELIKCSLQCNVKFDYYCLISGQDFPIKNNAYIQNFFTSNEGVNYIEVLKHDDPLFIRYRKRNDIYYPKWMFSRKTYIKIIKRLYIYLTGGYTKTFKVFRREYATKFEFEYGSQWWCLTHGAIKWIYSFLVEKKGLELFQNSMTPDECVFQTVFMMSPYKNQKADKLTYLEWNKSLNNPRILQLSDLELLLNDKNHLFARKFDLDIDRNIVEKLHSCLKEV